MVPSANVLSMFSMHFGTNVMLKGSLYYERTRIIYNARVVLAISVGF